MFPLIIYGRDNTAWNFHSRAGVLSQLKVWKILPRFFSNIIPYIYRAIRATLNCSSYEIVEERDCRESFARGDPRRYVRPITRPRQRFSKSSAINLTSTMSIFAGENGRYVSRNEGEPYIYVYIYI